MVMLQTIAASLHSVPFGQVLIANCKLGTESRLENLVNYS